MARRVLPERRASPVLVPWLGLVREDFREVGGRHYGEDVSRILLGQELVVDGSAKGGTLRPRRNLVPWLLLCNIE